MTARLFAVLVLFAGLSSPGAAAPPAGKRYAVLVGINTYEHPKLPALKFAENDVTELAAVLQSNGYEVQLLTTAAKDEGRSPTRANIARQLAATLEKCKKEDIVMVAFAGHGLQFEKQQDAFFCPLDAKPFADETKTLVSLKHVYESLDKSNAGMKVLLVDACRNDPKSGRGRGVDADAAPPPPKGMAALFSCSAGQTSWESEKYKHGVFFHHILQGLKGEAADKSGEVTFGALSAYATRQVTKDVPVVIGDGAEQNPHKRADYTIEPVLVSRSGVTVAPPGQTADYSTISEAIKSAPPGTVIMVKPGTYKESLVLDKSVEIIGDGKREEIIIESADSDCFDIGAERVGLRRLTLKCVNTGTLYSGVRVTRGKVAIDDCDITTTSFMGISASGSDTELTVRLCEIHDCKDSSLRLVHGATGVFEKCKFVNAKVMGISMHNKSHATFIACDVRGSETGVYLSDGCRIELEKCVLSDNSTNGLSCTNQCEVTLKGCFVNKNTLSGVYIGVKCRATIEDCDLTENKDGSLFIEDDAKVTKKNNKE